MAKKVRLQSRNKCCRLVSSQKIYCYWEHFVKHHRMCDVVGAILRESIVSSDSAVSRSTSQLTFFANSIHTTFRSKQTSKGYAKADVSHNWTNLHTLESCTKAMKNFLTGFRYYHLKFRVTNVHLSSSILFNFYCGVRLLGLFIHTMNYTVVTFSLLVSAEHS